MSASTAFALRPLERTPATLASNALEGAFRVHLSQKEMKSLELGNGDLIRLKTAAGFRGYAVAWLVSSSGPLNKPIAKVTDLLREEYRLSLNEPAFIEKAVDDWKFLKSVVVSCSGNAIGSEDELLDGAYYALSDLDLILPGYTFAVSLKQVLKGAQRSAKVRMVVESIEPQTNERYAMRFNPRTTAVTMTGAIPPGERSPVAPVIMQIRRDGIGGLSDQVTALNEDLALRMRLAREGMDHGQYPPIAFLLHGTEGTGKSLLLERLAECTWNQVHRVNSTMYPKGQAKAISDACEAALDNQPSLILLDRIDDLLGEAKNLAETLKTELCKLRGSQVVVAATARNIDAVDPGLRREVFEEEIEFFPPNATAREDMLRQMFDSHERIGNTDFPRLAARTHGFVGGDIKKLCKLARLRQTRLVVGSMATTSETSLKDILAQSDTVTQQAFEDVIERIQPTVLKGAILEVPKIRWTDIAGLDHVRTQLEAITIRPFKFPDLEAKFGGPQSRKGVLLYGPPGCAKTLLAQAVATESNQNFLAVKGSELIKMYVGESERAIRDLFRQARAAKPCIIFFDEIDSIGKSREKTQDSGLNVVTTLLNEMDGVEALQGVFIIGATNRPDILDSALIRTGRFDSHIHIGLPTEEARQQILKIHTRKHPLASDVNLFLIAERTQGSSGADIKGLCAVAREMAVQDYTTNPEGEALVRMCHYEQALTQHVPHTPKEEAERYKNWRPGKSLN